MFVIHAKKAKNIVTKTIGLLGAKTPYPLFLQTRFGIHTFGMQFPIDVVILDETFHIVRIKKQLVPNRVYLWPPIWRQVLELPAGTIEKKQFHIGDQCRVTFIN